LPKIKAGGMLHVPTNGLESVNHLWSHWGGISPARSLHAETKKLQRQEEEIRALKNVHAGHSSRAVWGVDLGRLFAGIVGSNLA
jgi:hypothetical protein